MSLGRLIFTIIAIAGYVILVITVLMLISFPRFTDRIMSEYLFDYKATRSDI